jgi:hypothetical protein
MQWTCASRGERERVSVCTLYTHVLRWQAEQAGGYKRPGGLVDTSGHSLGPVGEAFCLLHKRLLHDPAGLAPSPPCYDSLRVRRLRVSTVCLAEMDSDGWGWNNGTDRSNFENFGALMAEHGRLRGWS